MQKRGSEVVAVPTSGEKLQNNGFQTSEFFPGDPPLFICVPVFGNLWFPHLSFHHSLYSTPRFPTSLGESGSWATPPSPPSLDLLGYRPRLVLEPQRWACMPAAPSSLLCT